MPNPIEIAQTGRRACAQVAPDDYQQAQLAGLCEEGAWEVAVDAMRMLDLKEILRTTGPEDCLPPPPRGPSSA